jgi:hypothetical protein
MNQQRRKKTTFKTLCSCSYGEKLIVESTQNGFQFSPISFVDKEIRAHE